MKIRDEWSMKRICIGTIVLVIFALGVWLANPRSTAAQQTGEAGHLVELKGVITDSMCGAKHMMSGDDRTCVDTCVKGGAHYALLAGEVTRL
jgi:hypothetical protein